MDNIDLVERHVLNYIRYFEIHPFPFRLDRLSLLILDSIETCACGYVKWKYGCINIESGKNIKCKFGIKSIIFWGYFVVKILQADLVGTESVPQSSACTVLITKYSFFTILPHNF